MSRAKLVLILVLAVTAASPAIAAKRVAFLIGNSAYAHAAPLANPARDVELVGETLEGLGFTVTQLSDLSRDGIGRELSGFP